MTKFETRGVELQQESTSRFQAESRFNHSCDLCCKFGLHIECDRCAISVVHDQLMNGLNAFRHSQDLSPNLI